MSTKHPKLYLLIGSMLGIMCCAFGCMSIVNSYNRKYPSEKAPIRTVSIEIDQNQREALFDQLRKFSKKYGLEFHLSFYKNKQIFFVEIYGMGLEILALSKPDDTTHLDIVFYERDPAEPPPQKTIDELVSDLKEFISVIPNVTITGEK
jgi:hypothetical protein